VKITNNCSYDLIAFGWDTRLGYGDDVTIAAKQSGEVSGPYVGEMGGGSCHLSIEGDIVCHEGDDDSNGFNVSKGNQLALQGGTQGVTVRHFSEDRDV